MKFFLLLLACLAVLGCNQQKPSQIYKNKYEPPSQKTVLLFVKIPESIQPIERGKKYEDPLDNFLKAKGLGEVSGGGSQLSEANASGQRTIEWVGIDVDVYDPEKAIPLVVEKLKELEVPKGTVIEQQEPVKRIITVK